MSDQDNIEELDAQPASVASVIARLHRQQDTITSITAIVEYSDGNISVGYNEKLPSKMALDALILQRHIIDLITE